MYRADLRIARYIINFLYERDLKNLCPTWNSFELSESTFKLYLKLFKWTLQFCILILYFDKQNFFQLHLLFFLQDNRIFFHRYDWKIILSSFQITYHLKTDCISIFSATVRFVYLVLQSRQCKTQVLQPSVCRNVHSLTFLSSPWRYKSLFSNKKYFEVLLLG